MSDGRPRATLTPDFNWEPPTGPPIIGQPVAYTGTPAPPQNDGRVRPWWGMGDALLMIPIMMLVLLVSLLVVAILALVEGLSIDQIGDPNITAIAPSMLIIPTLIQQATWLGWPLVVSKWKGLGPASDWGWSFKPVDLGIGLGTAMIAMFAAGVAATVTGTLINLEDETLAENTQIITDLKGSPWLFGLIFVVVIGAPLSEEILFRGLIMRSVQKRWGAVAGVIGSLLFFVPIHIADGGVFSDGQLVLWASIASLGAVLAIAAIMTERLGASIVAHAIINALATAGALGYLDAIGDRLPS